MATKFEFYDAGDDSYVGLGSGTWGAQTFTPSEDFAITSVVLKMFRFGTPGTVTVSIRATTGDPDEPTGADIDSVTGTTDGDTLTTNVSGEWREITFSAPINLTSGVTYAIITRSASTSLRWRIDSSSSGYAGGNYAHSTNSGSTWSGYSGGDYMFETWGEGVGGGVITTPHYYHKLLAGNS